MLEVVQPKEFENDIVTKDVSGTTWGDGETLSLAVRITPHNVRDRSIVRNLAESIKDPELIKHID
jgi:hypothetical protein